MPGPGADLVGAEELAELNDVIASGHLSRFGPDDASFPAKVRRFEETVAELAGTGYALAVNSGTSALFLALVGLGIGPGDEVIVPGFTYVATISSVVYARARPVLAEVDETFDLDPADVEARITPRTRAIIAVHMLGNPARIAELRAVADRHGLALIEDCAQAFGATYGGRWVGSHGSVGTYSFNEFKTITCGDGGMLVTDDEALYRRAFAMHDQGHSPNRRGVEVGNRPFLGLNFRMTELEGAVLLAQVRRIDRIRDHLRANRDIVHDIIGEVRGHRVPDAARPGRRPGDAPGRHLPRCRHGQRRDQRARLEHTRHVGLACLHGNGARVDRPDSNRSRLPVRLHVYGPVDARLPRRDAAGH